MRLDLRTLTEDLLIKVIDYVNKLDANLYYQNQIVVPSMDNICNIIKNSDAYRFCKNPNMYFENLIIENRTNI